MLTYDKKSKQPRGLGRGAYRGMGKNLFVMKICINIVSGRGLTRGRGMPGGHHGGGRGGGRGGYGGRGRPSSRAFHGTPGFMRNSERAKYGDGGGYGRR